MKFRLTTVVLLLAPYAAAGVVAPDLVPFDREASEFASSPAHRAYHLAVRDALLGPQNRSPCEVLVLPSFEPEWAVHVDAGQASEHRIVWSEMKEHFWYKVQMAAERPDGSIPPESMLAAVRRVPKDVSRRSAPVAGSTVDILKRVWLQMLSRAREPPKRRFSIDGVSYFFFQWRSGGYIGGHTSSPKPDTTTRSLVDLAAAMRRHVSLSGTALVRSDIQLARTASTLSQQLRDLGEGESAAQRGVAADGAP